MIKYIVKSVLRFAVTAAVIFGAAAACGTEYKLLAGENGGEELIAFEKVNDCEGTLSVGPYSFDIDLELIASLRGKVGEYIDCATSYLPRAALKAGEYLYDTAASLAGK